MSTSTTRRRYDNKGNLISTTTLNDNGTSYDIKRYIEYDSDDNIKSIKTVKENTYSTGKKETTSSTTEYEYIKVDDTFIVSKITKDGSVDRETEIESSFNTVSGDKLYNSKSIQYVYSDTPEHTVVNTIISRTSQIEEDDRFLEGFDTAHVDIEMYSMNIVEDERHTYGSYDNICCYHRNVVWTVDEDNSRIGKVKDLSWKEAPDSNPDDVMHFYEYISSYTVDQDGNMILEDESERFVNDVYLTIDMETKKPKSLEIDTKIEDGFTIRFSTTYSATPFGADTKITNKTLNLDTGEVITNIVKLQSVGKDVFREYTQDNQKIHYEAEYTEINGKQVIVGEITETTDLRIANAKTIDEKVYMYDDKGQVILITNNYGPEDYPASIHLIYEYDSEGRNTLCVSENSLFYAIFSKDGKESYEVNQIDYPMCKSLFDFCYNKLLSSV